MNYTTDSAKKKIAYTSISFLMIILVGYYFFIEIKKNDLNINELIPAIKVHYLIIALVLSILSYLLETLIWQIVIRKQPGYMRVTLYHLATIIFASGLCRYLPGRIWTYAAQFIWLKQYGINKSLIVYINFICLIELGIVSLYSAIFFIAVYTDMLTSTATCALMALLLGMNLIFNCCSNFVANKILTFAGKIIKLEIQPISIAVRSMFTIQFIYSCCWFLGGLAVYFLCKGVSLPVSLNDMVPVVSAMSLSTLAGYLAVFSPGGLGIREGMMLLMLKPVLAVKAALMIPILSRLMTLLTELILGCSALFIGIRTRLLMR